MELERFTGAVVPTPRADQMLFRFPNGWGASIILDPAYNRNPGYARANQCWELGFIQWVPEGGEPWRFGPHGNPITGWSDVVMRGVGVDDLRETLARIEALPLDLPASDRPEIED